jgi:fatty-acyl-CoA synthase
MISSSWAKTQVSDFALTQLAKIRASTFGKVQDVSHCAHDTGASRGSGLGVKLTIANAQCMINDIESGDPVKPNALPHPFWPQGVPASLVYPKTALTYNFEVSAKRFPDRPCLIFYGHSLSYSQAWHVTMQMASYLKGSCGLQRGDRVLVDLQNSPQFVIAYYAVLLAGGMVVPINPMSKTEELRYYLSDSGAQVALVANDVAHWINPLLGNSALRKVIVAQYSDYADLEAGLSIPSFVTSPAAVSFDEAMVRWRDALLVGDAQLVQTQPSSHDVGPDDYCVLPYTSGSTAFPKGCIHTHGTVNASAQIYGAWRTTYADAVILATAPFFHVTGMMGSMNVGLMIGAAIVLLPRWDAEVAAQLIETYHCTHWTNVPPMVVDLLTNPKAAGRNLASLTSIGGGGAAMPAAIAQRLKDEFNLSYIEGYGMSEFMAATHSNPHDRPKKQCLGIPIVDCAAKIINPDTLEELGPNQQGEIIMSGPNLMKGYWGLKDDPYSGGLLHLDGRDYFRSGDLGYTDEDGYYFISDRLKRMINASGFKVWPAEIEGYFYKHPAVKECCVVAAPDEKRGETVRLVAVLKDEHQNTTAEQLIAWARENMANYKAPTEVIFMTALPRTSTGKLFWRQLQDQAFGRETSG